MPRPLRIEYAGARYHVMSRGDRREAIFHDDADRQEFCTLGPSLSQDGVASACLLPDEQSFSSGDRDAAAESVAGNEVAPGHLHATIQSAASALGASLWRTLQGAIDRWALPPGYLRAACDYVHLNPVRAGIVRSGQKLKQIPLEQLSGIPAAETATGLAAPRSVAGRARFGERYGS